MSDIIYISLFCSFLALILLFVACIMVTINNGNQKDEQTVTSDSLHNTQFKIDMEKKDLDHKSSVELHDTALPEKKQAMA